MTVFAGALPTGQAVDINYRDAAYPHRNVILNCYRPASHTPDSPFVMLFPSNTRDGAAMRTHWRGAADAHGLLLVGCSFPKADWRGSALYNEGCVRDESGAVQPPETWSYTIPEHVAACLRAEGLIGQQSGYLWGHSAGGQFVHRLMATQRGTRFIGGTANAGSYTLPVLDQPFPAGLGGIGLGEAEVAAYLARKMTIFAGDADTGQGGQREDDAARAQGPHRFARAQFFLQAGRGAAARLGMACGWQLVVAPGVGHAGRYMGYAAQAHWFGTAPDAAPAG